MNSFLWTVLGITAFLSILSLVFCVFLLKTAFLDLRGVFDRLAGVESRIQNLDHTALEKIYNRLVELESGFKAVQNEYQLMDDKVASIRARANRAGREEKRENQEVDPATLPGAIPLDNQGSYQQAQPVRNGNSPFPMFERASGRDPRQRRR